MRRVHHSGQLRRQGRILRVRIKKLGESRDARKAGLGGELLCEVW